MRAVKLKTGPRFGRLYVKTGPIFLKLTDTICVRKGEKTRIFVATICFDQNFLDQNSVKQEAL